VAGGALGAVASGTTTGTVGSLDWGGGSTAPVLVDELGSVVLVCAPPLLPTVTPGATSALDDVAPDGFGSPVAVDAPSHSCRWSHSHHPVKLIARSVGCSRNAYQWPRSLSSNSRAPHHWTQAGGRPIDRRKMLQT